MVKKQPINKRIRLLAPFYCWKSSKNWFGEPNGPISSLVKRTKQSQVKKRTQDNIKCSRLFPWRAEKQSNEKNVLEIYVILENSEKTN